MLPAPATVLTAAPAACIAKPFNMTPSPLTTYRRTRAPRLQMELFSFTIHPLMNF
jgi:hypothetical protein